MVACGCRTGGKHQSQGSLFVWGPQQHRLRTRRPTVVPARRVYANDVGDMPDPMSPTSRRVVQRKHSAVASPTGATSTTTTVPTARSACSHRPRSLPNTAPKTNQHSHNGWTNNRGPVKHSAMRYRCSHRDHRSPCHLAPGVTQSVVFSRRGTRQLRRSELPGLFRGPPRRCRRRRWRPPGTSRQDLVARKTVDGDRVDRRSRGLDNAEKWGAAAR